MATQLSTSSLNVAAIRSDFPILDQVDARGQRLVYLDSAATSQKPAAVLAALDHYYRHLNANVHRGVYRLSEAATEQYEAARGRAAAFINAASDRECVFVRNTTEAINLVAQTWGRGAIGEGDLIVLTVMEHHSNIVPWQRLAAERGAELAYVPLTDDHQLDLAAFAALMQREPKLVAVTHVSNALGTINDIAQIARQARAAGAVVLVDAAQSAPHLALDVQTLGVDFLAFSGHKMLGPMGAGVLWGRRELLEAMPPFLVGGSMIRKVSLTESTWAEVPAKFEAGTPAVGEAIGLAAAIDYLTNIRLDRVVAHEQAIVGYALERLRELPGITLYGPKEPAHRCGVVSFIFDQIHPHDVASILDGEHVAVRAGHHCTQPLLACLGVVATTRASFYVYNDESDVDRLVDALWVADRIFHGPRSYASHWPPGTGDAPTGAVPAAGS
jgi:cysteine desulfurase/selenocysteine lyase